MTEYWVSRDKFFCKYCKIYIADDQPSRSHHDIGLRHKGNYERYIRDIYKKGERDIKDKAEEAREIARMDAAAQAAMASDSTFASTSTDPLPPQIARRPRPVPASSDPFANYSTAASLGYVDPEADQKSASRLALEARQKEGIIGQWESVKIKAQPSATELAERAEELQREKKEEEYERYMRPGGSYLSERQEIPLEDSEDEAYDKKLIKINVKRKRLTLKEEEEIGEEKKVKEKIQRKIEKEVQKAERKEARMTRTGWNEAEVTDQPMLMFDPIPKKGEELDASGSLLEGGSAEIIKAEDGTEDGTEEEQKPEVPVVAIGGFKKRKMLGASATRKK